MSSSESSMFQDNALSILNAFPDPIAVLDSKGTILWCNPATFEVAQMSSEELLGRKFTALSGLSLSNIPKYVKLFASAVAGKEIAPTEVEWKRSDGTTILAEARVSSIRMTDNKRAILVISRDLTPLREAESAISTARDRAQQYLDIAGVIIVALNTEGKATMINRYGCSKLGVPANKVIGKKFFDTFVPKQYREAAREFFYHLANDESEAKFYECPIISHEAEEKKIRWYFSPLKDKKNRVTGILGSGEDISDFARIEDLLRKSEEKHRLFFENAQAPFFQVQLENGLVLDCNIQGAQLFGFESPQDMIRKVRLSDFYYNPPDRLKLLRELKDKGTVKNYLLHLKKKDGLELWVEISSIPDFKEGTIAAVVIDVTNRKMAEDALKASEQRYRDFMNGMPVGIGISDLRERFIFANPIFCRMTGYSQDEMEKMKTLDIVAPEEHKKILTETQLRASGEPSVYETRLIRKDGTEFAVSISAAPYRNELNVVIGTIALVADVTVSKQTEAAMKVSETRLKSLIEQLPVGVVIADFDERIELVNQALSEIFWRKREVLIGTKLTEYLSPESILKIKRETMGRIDGIKSTYDITVIRADGVNRDVRVWGAPNYNNYGEAIGTLGVFEDITEQKRNETIRKRQEQEIDLYSSLLRHDLKNDLGLIRNYIEAVEMLLKSADEEATSFLNSAISAVERMTDLLNTFGKPQTMREIDIVDFISEVAGESQKAQKSLRINVAYSANTTPANITAGGLLALVFMNLFRNAAQHAGMNPEIDVKVSKTDTMISVIVSDDGPGIAEELKSKLFTRGASGKGEAGGLGLYLSKEIMERTGGSIELVPGKKGATFLLKIPIQA